MNRVVGVLGVLVTALAVACIALAIALVNASSTTSPIQEKLEEGAVADPEPEPEPEPELIGTEPWETNVRLPRHLLPKHYDLYLHPNLESGEFTGRVGIDIEAVDSTSYLITHVKDLQISSTVLKDEKGKKLPISKAFEYKRNEYWVVLPETKLGLGNYTLEMEFSGNLTNGITGFYKSVYTNMSGEKVPIATSKFQPTDARKAFPCFDEPSFKSTFSTKLVRPSDRYIALSNMPEADSVTDSPVQGLTTVRFKKSVPMVTYLACFIVCDFEYQEQVTAQHGTLFRVYATPQQRDTVKYALGIGANITDFFTNYFDIPYPLPKQDMIAIPDFSSGAMEHWGLITYRETNLLYDERKSSTSNQQRVAAVVSHELAHQWFGNLVTLEWWDDLWLNEGFASYMEYKGVAQYHDDWEIMDQFLSSDLHSVMNLDATVNSHAIVQDVSHPDQITEIFDAISYNKGASVLRMLENFMGAPEFRQGIHNFLKRFIYKNAVTSDLWRELEAVSTKRLPISKIMDTWTRQMGYPVLNVDRISETRYRVTQQRYLIDQEAVDKVDSPYDYKWDVPVSWISSGEASTTLKWLSREESMLEVNLPPGTSWVKFNVGQFGYYRVNYPLEDWERLANLLVNDASALPSSDRASLLNDAFSLAESGHIPYTVPLSMTKYLKNEFNLVPWKTVYNKMVDLKEILTYTPAFPLLQEYIRGLVKDHYTRLGWENTGSHAQKLNRNNIINLACGSGLPECNKKAAELFKAWIKDPTVYIHPNLRNSVYKYGMAASGDAMSWEIMLERYLSEGNAQEKRKLLYGLCQIKEPWILNRLMLLAQNETNVRSQDYFTVLSYVNRNPVGNPIVWKFLQSEWSSLVERFGLNSRYLGRMPKSISYDFSTQFQLEEVQAFFRAYPEAGAGTRARKQAVERIQLNIKWLKDHQTVVHSWLKNRN